jgi:hypothetical protein
VRPLISSQQGGEALQAGSAVRRAADEAKNETLEALGWLMLFAGCDRAREPLAEFGIHRDQPPRGQPPSWPSPGSGGPLAILLAPFVGGSRRRRYMAMPDMEKLAG